MAKIIRRLLYAVFALILFIPAQAGAQDEGSAEYHPGRVLVKFKQMPAAQDLRAFAAAHRLRLEGIISRIEAYKFAIPQNQKVLQVVERLQSLDVVDYAEPDYERHAFYTPTDPMFSQQWDMLRVGLPTWWDLEKGDLNVVVAVIDTGVDLDHPDLSARLWRNLDEIPSNSIDDDHNGYVDDYNGFDFAGDGLFPWVGAQDPIPDDGYVGHGTHVSGTIAATQDNGIGISGEAPLVKIMAVRVLGGMGTGYASDISDGIIYAAANGAHVINMSLGGTGKSTTEYNALKFAWDHNVFIAAASGNDGDTASNPVNYPAAYVFAMSVGATDSTVTDTIASFSTHNEFVEISAPGVNILSTIPNGMYEGGWSGTSMATPHVAGLGALLYSMYTGIDNWQVRSMLQKGAIDRGTTGWDAYYGYGRADCVRLLSTPTPSPSVLKILAPAKGIKFTSGAAVGILWNPVLGATSYRMTVTLPNKTTKVITTKVPYYTVPPSQPMPLGSYTVKVDALASNGAVLSYDTINFSK